MWAVRDELTQKLCGDQPTCAALDAGGLRVITTLDVRLQRIAEKWVRAAAIVPHARTRPPRRRRSASTSSNRGWPTCSSKALRNGALVAYDYQTGELVAYVGSASYYATSTRPEFQPQFDVAGKGFRQPGSAFKPFNYVTGIDDHALTAGDHADGRIDRLRRRLHAERRRPPRAWAGPGPQRPPVLAQHPGRPGDGDQYAGPRVRQGARLRDGLPDRSDPGRPRARPGRPGGPAGRPGDRLRDAGQRRQGDRPHDDPQGPGHRRQRRRAGVPAAGRHAGRQPAGGVHRDRHPERQHQPQDQSVLGQVRASTGPDRRRPATLKTGTNNDAKDLNAYGYIAPPTEEDRAAGAYALAVGVWNGNSDNSLVSTAKAPLFSIDVSTYVWQGFLQEASADWPVEDFAVPADGLTQADIDPWTGLLANARRPAVKEWFITGTEPKNRLAPGVVRRCRAEPGRLRVPVRQLAGGRPRTGCAGPRSAPERPVARIGLAPATSTTGGSSRSGRRGGRCSGARAAPRRARRPAASRSRRPTRAA